MQRSPLIGRFDPPRPFPVSPDSPGGLSEMAPPILPPVSGLLRVAGGFERGISLSMGTVGGGSPRTEAFNQLPD